MKFVVAIHGTRGDAEPGAAIGMELAKRGHDVWTLVPPNLVSLFRSVGLDPVDPWGPDSRTRVLSWNSAAVGRWAASRAQAAGETPGHDSHPGMRFQNPLRLLSQFRSYLTDGWDQMSDQLAKVSADADLILTGIAYQELAANVAESLDIPLASIHYFPLRANPFTLPLRLPRFLVEPAFAVVEWAYGLILKPATDRQRRTLRLPASRVRPAKSIVDRGTLEMQLYDEMFFPGLDEEWKGRRPFVGSVSMGLQTESDDDVLAWIAEGEPPVYFGFGSTPVESPADLLLMIQSVCTDLGLRALVNSSGWTQGAANPDTSGSVLKIVDGVNYPSVFPRCAALVHHGGSGTMAEAIRSGVPTVALWSTADQPVWANRLDALKIGTGERFSRMTRKSLTEALRTVLAPEYAERTRALAAKMTPPGDAVAKAADLLEVKASSGKGHHYTN